MRCRFARGLVFLCCICVTQVVRGEEKFAEPIKVDLERFEAPSEDDRKNVSDWILDLESTTMLAEKLAVAVTGESYFATEMDDGETVNARRFAFTWAIDNTKDRDRIVFGDESIINPVVWDGRDALLQYSNAFQYDRLRLGDTYHEAVGTDIRDPSKVSFVTRSLKMHGVFFPVCAASTTASEIYTGGTFKENELHIGSKNLVGIHKMRDLVLAEFEYRPTPVMSYFRVAVFRDGDPIQIEDFMTYLRKELPPLNPVDPSKRDRDELEKLHRQLRPQASGQVNWTRVGDLHLPVALKTRRGGSPRDRNQAQFSWKVNDEVPATAFSTERLGRTGPLAVLE